MRRAIDNETCQVSGCPRVRQFPSWYCEEHRGERQQKTRQTVPIVSVDGERRDVEIAGAASGYAVFKREQDIALMEEQQRGLAEQRRQLQEQVNYWQSRKAELAQLAPYGPFQVTPEQEELIRRNDRMIELEYWPREEYESRREYREAEEARRREAEVRQVAIDRETGISLRYIRQFDAKTDRLQFNRDAFKIAMAPLETMKPKPKQKEKVAPLNVDLKRQYFED
jgi:hypothetical protein